MGIGAVIFDMDGVLIEAKDFAGDYSFLWGTRQVKQ